MKFSYIVKLAGIALIGAALSQPGFAKDKVYTWTDAKGTIHFGERPPHNVKATLVKTRTGHSDPTPEQAAATQPKPVANNVSAAQQAALKDPERCAKARENMTMLNSVARIRTVNPEGVTVYLTEEDKTKQREISQQIIDQACE